MIILKLATNGLDLIKLETSLVTSDNKKSVSLEVTFDDSWTGYGKSATFKSSSSDKIYEVPLANNACVVPWEVLESVGTMSVGVRGVKDDGSVIASDLVDYKIAQGAKTGDGTSEDPTPTVYEQLLSNYGSVDQKITKEIQDRANAIATEKSERMTEVDVERKRIDNIVKLPSGSTSGDAELMDIRIGADGTTYDSAGTAVREQISSLKGDLDTLAENDFIAILNRKLDVIKGKFEKGSIDENGQNVFSNDLIRSIDYIKIYPGIPYQFKTINGNGLVIRIYKSDGSIRSEYMGATATERTRTITFNSDDEKIRVVINTYKNDYTTYPVSADNFESIIANVSEYIAKDYNYGSIYNGTINIDTVNKIVSTSGVSILTNYGVFIKVPAGEINIDYEVAVYIGVNKYDSEHNLIVRTLDSSMASDFIRIFVYHKGKVWFADKINGITINGKNYNENVKTICCIGDSFTASNISWHTFIGQNLGYNMVNLGVSGTRMTVTYTGGGTGTNYECFIDRVANGALNSYSPDLIVLFGGINDTVKLHNNQMYIGTIDDEAEYSASKTSNYSFIGRVKYLINLIKEKKPSAQILGVIPPNYSEGTSGYEWWAEYIAQIQEALRKVYEYYGIPYVDLKKRCQEMYENAYNLSAYRINGRSNMHPSNNGYKAIAKCIQKDGIENMFVN